MTHNFQVSLSKLERLSAVKLDKASRRIRSEMADAEWKMSVCLLAIKRSGAFRKLGFGTLTDYAERVSFVGAKGRLLARGGGGFGASAVDVGSVSRRTDRLV